MGRAVRSRRNAARFRRGELRLPLPRPGAFLAPLSLVSWGALNRHGTGLGDVTGSIFTLAWGGGVSDLTTLAFAGCWRIPTSSGPAVLIVEDKKKTSFVPKSFFKPVNSRYFCLDLEVYFLSLL